MSSSNFRLVRQTDRYHVNTIRSTSGGVLYELFDRFSIEQQPTFANWDEAYRAADDRNKEWRST